MTKILRISVVLLIIGIAFIGSEKAVAHPHPAPIEPVINNPNNIPSRIQWRFDPLDWKTECRLAPGARVATNGIKFWGSDIGDQIDMYPTTNITNRRENPWEFQFNIVGGACWSDTHNYATDRHNLDLLRVHFTYTRLNFNYYTPAPPPGTPEYIDITNLLVEELDPANDQFVVDFNNAYTGNYFYTKIDPNPSSEAPSKGFRMSNFTSITGRPGSYIVYVPIVVVVVNENRVTDPADPDRWICTGTGRRAGNSRGISGECGSDELVAQVPVEIPAPTDQATCDIVAPMEVRPNEDFTTSVTAENRGGTTWNNNYSFFSEDASTWGISPALKTVSGTVAPGATQTKLIANKAPGTPGTYQYRWQMHRTNPGVGSGVFPTPCSRTIVVANPTTSCTISLVRPNFPPDVKSFYADTEVRNDSGADWTGYYRTIPQSHPEAGSATDIDALEYYFESNWLGTVTRLSTVNVPAGGTASVRDESPLIPSNSLVSDYLNGIKRRSYGTTHYIQTSNHVHERTVTHRGHTRVIKTDHTHYNWAANNYDSSGYVSSCTKSVDVQLFDGEMNLSLTEYSAGPYPGYVEVGESIKINQCIWNKEKAAYAATRNIRHSVSTEAAFMSYTGRDSPLSDTHTLAGGSGPTDTCRKMEFGLINNEATRNAIAGGLDEICYTATLEPHTGQQFPYYVVTSTPLSQQICIPVRLKVIPQVKVLGNDVYAGTQLTNDLNKTNSTLCTTDEGYDRNNPAFANIRGKGINSQNSNGQYGVAASGSITQFNSNNQPANTATSKLLSFSNDGAVAGSYNGICRPDITNEIRENILGTNTPPIENRVNITPTIASGRSSPGVDVIKDVLWIRAPAGGHVEIRGPQVPPGGKLTIIVEGDVYIRDDIRYNSNYVTRSTIPALAIIADGNIMIDPSVTTLDGLYVANDVDGTGIVDGGSISTCSNGGSLFSPTINAGNSDNCGNQLTVNGAFVAREIFFRRTFGGVSSDTHPNQPAEQFIFYPEMYLSPPPFGDGFTTQLRSRGFYDLPPVY